MPETLESFVKYKQHTPEYVKQHSTSSLTASRLPVYTVTCELTEHLPMFCISHNKATHSIITHLTHNASNLGHNNMFTCQLYSLFFFGGAVAVDFVLSVIISGYHKGPFSQKLEPPASCHFFVCLFVKLVSLPVIAEYCHIGRSKTANKRFCVLAHKQPLKGGGVDNKTKAPVEILLLQLNF